MDVVLVYDPALGAYRFGAGHPMRPERFTLAVELMESWGLLGDAEDRAREIRPEPATDEELELFHAEDYVAYVKAASAEPARAGRHGIGYGDTPAFRGMHEAAALAVGATIRAVADVVSGAAARGFSPAGGLHHAQRDRASGFCVYNDVAVAIERTTRTDPKLRIAYVDIDAHHGDGVEHAFETRPEVLTLSVHESGRYLFPGTGRERDIGRAAGVGAAVNVPLPPYAGPDCYETVFAEVIEPAVRAFGPDLVVLQAGGDSHRNDPLTHLCQSIAGYYRLVTQIVTLAEQVCGGRIVVTGGGGYQPFSEVPRMWAGVLSILLGRQVPSDLPQDWIDRSRQTALDAGSEPSSATRTLEEALPEPDAATRETAMQATLYAVRKVREASPLLGGAR